MHILITSVGSLLGQNILDALETRRQYVTVTGTNTQTRNPRVFRCDNAYWVPPTQESALFEHKLLEIIAHEKPDIILPGRDADILFLAGLKQKYPELQTVIPCGTLTAAQIIYDKRQSFEFALNHHLPFANSYYSRQGKNAEQAFLQQIQFPIIAKPFISFGSRSVFLVSNHQQFQNLVKMDNIIFQEYLQPPDNLNHLLNIWETSIPLFFQIPEMSQYACQTIISPSGEVLEIFCSINHLVMGRVEYSERVSIPELTHLTQEYARALSKIGWQGSLNLQCKPDLNGQWKVYEMNARMSGSSSARLLMGYDEIGLLTKIFLPHIYLKNFTTQQKPGGVVFRTLTDCFVNNQDIAMFEQNGKWQKKQWIS